MKIIKAVTPVFILALLSACATVHYDKPVASFQKSVDESVTVIGKYYQELNSNERSLYLESALLDPSREILFRDEQGRPTPLAGNIFPADSIKARLDSLTLIGIYASRLSALAGNSAPAQFAGHVKVLGTNLTRLSDTFSFLDGSKDPTASSYVGPVASLAGLVGQMYMEHRRDEVLARAIVDGDPAVRKILELVEADLVMVIDPLKKTGDKQQLAEIVNYYNNNRMKMTYSERRRTIDSIKAAAESYSASTVFNPSSLVSTMAEAHRALVKYAKSAKKPQDLAELADMMDLFAAHVDIVASSLGKIQKIK